MEGRGRRREGTRYVRRTRKPSKMSPPIFRKKTMCHTRSSAENPSAFQSRADELRKRFFLLSVLSTPARRSPGVIAEYFRRSTGATAQNSYLSENFSASSAPKLFLLRKCLINSKPGCVLTSLDHRTSTWPSQRQCDGSLKNVLDERLPYLLKPSRHRR